MASILKNHPFAVEAFFTSSLVLSYAVPKEELKSLLPDCLEVDNHNQYGFFTVAMVQTKALRPKGFPAFLGNDFFLLGYRLFVRYTTTEGKNLRGLYILGSQTDKKKMKFFGNIFTHYNYTTTDISIENTDNKTKIHSKASGIDILIDTSRNEVTLPAGSPFANWKEARRFAGPLPFTVTFDKLTNQVTIIEGVRENWKPSPVHILHNKVAFIEQFGFSKIILANAFEVKNIPYYWKKGRTELWKP